MRDCTQLTQEKRYQIAAAGTFPKRDCGLAEAPQVHDQQPATEMSWLQNSKSAILRNQSTCCTFELNPRTEKLIRGLGNPGFRSQSGTCLQPAWLSAHIEQVGMRFS